MPINNWTRVSAGIFHDFHLVWMGELRTRLNNGLLPPDYYALVQQVTGPFGLDVLTIPVESTFGETEGKRRLVIHLSSDDRVVARLEILSPENKTSRYSFQNFVEQAANALAQGVHLLLVDLFPPSPQVPRGCHDAIWTALGDDSFVPPGDKPLTMVAYKSDVFKAAFLESMAVGDELPAMPLFLTSDTCVTVPLEESYQAAYRGVPRRWRTVLEQPPA